MIGRYKEYMVTELTDHGPWMVVGSVEQTVVTVPHVP